MLAIKGDIGVPLAVIIIVGILLALVVAMVVLWCYRKAQVRRQIRNEASIAAQVKDRLKKVLKQRYSNMVLDMERNAPLEEVYVKLRLQRYDTENLPLTAIKRDVVDMEERMQNSQEVLLQNLFDSMDDRVAPKKLLIRGKAGVGKTTLVRRIASQWAAGNLWKNQFSYVFVITLRELLPNKTWTLCELLLGGLPLSSPDKVAAFGQICRNAEDVLCLVDGLDEVPYENKTSISRDCNAPIDLSLMLSSIIGKSMLPDATIVITSRPTRKLPVRLFQRIVELYGFQRTSIYEYVSIFCAGKQHLKEFIIKNFEESQNLITYCYIPLQCQLVCQFLADVHSHGVDGDVPVIKTMTQLYMEVSINSACKLHPRLKYDSVEMDMEDVLQVVTGPFKKYADLAKHCVMTVPLRIIFYKGDLVEVGLRFDDEDDMQCGVMTQSRTGKTNVPSKICTCWSFNHLTLQEYFAAIGLLQGSTDDIWQLIEDKSAIYKHEVVISFLAGLSGDKYNADYMRQLLSSDVSLDHRELVKKLVQVLKNDPLKVITILYETQDPDVVAIVSSECNSNQVFPTEMEALSWVLRQAMCPVTNLDLSTCLLDADLAKQLNVGLAENASIHSLNLLLCDIPAEGMETLAAGIETLTALTRLNLSHNDVSPAAAERLAHSLKSLKNLEALELTGCHIQNYGARQIVEALLNVADAAAKKSRRLNYLHIRGNHITDDVVGELKTKLRKIRGREELCVRLDVQKSPSAGNTDCARVGCVRWS